VVLSLCASLYLLVIFGWIFTTMPEKYFLTVPLLIILHIFAGIANAGVTLTIGTIGSKLAPQGEATSYLATSSLATNLGAGLGPLVGGFLLTFFGTRQLNLNFTWIDPTGSIQFPALSIIGYDFLFVIAFIMGLVTLSILATIREEGEISREVTLESLMFPTRELSRPMSSVPAFNLTANFPFGYVRRALLPGLDVALGVTAYQIAEIGRTATLAAVRGRRVTKKLRATLKNGLNGIWRNKEGVKAHGVEITRQVTRGAVHATDEKPLDVAQMTGSVMAGVMKASVEAGVEAKDAILGASQGIIEGAAEIEADLSVATLQAMEVAREMAAQAGLPEESAVVIAAEGVLQTAEAIGPEAVAQVVESLPDEILTLIR
jgi:hypothetical protein